MISNRVSFKGNGGLGFPWRGREIGKCRAVEEWIRRGIAGEVVGEGIVKRFEGGEGAEGIVFGYGEGGLQHGMTMAMAMAMEEEEEGQERERKGREE